MPHSLTNGLFGHRKSSTDQKVSVDTVSEEKNGDDVPDERTLMLATGLATADSLWETALQRVSKETGWQPPAEWVRDEVSILDQVEAVRAAAEDKKDLTVQNERRIAGTDHTYRELYDKIAGWARDLQSVGDIIVQADPGYSALPWAVIRFAITAANGESEVYHTTLEGTAYVSQLTAQYSVFEIIYGNIKSTLVKELRKILEDFYVDLLKYQVFAIKYFDPERKLHRALTGLNPVKVQQVKAQRKLLDDKRDKVDRAIALVHREVSKKDLDELKAGKDALLKGQSEQLTSTRDGILALAATPVLLFGLRMRKC